MAVYGVFILSGYFQFGFIRTSKNSSLVYRVDFFWVSTIFVIFETSGELDEHALEFLKISLLAKSIGVMLITD